MNNQQQVCENCGKLEDKHFDGAAWCYSANTDDDRVMLSFTPKPTPDPKVEQVAQRPYVYGFTENTRPVEKYMDSQDAKIASLEKELREAKATISKLEKSL